MTESHLPPRVSVCIPLYAARPWADRIVDNITRNAAPEVEFVLSDQHGLDDAIDAIRQRIGDRARVRYFSSRTRGGWIDNFNHVLREALGDYVRILSQDDVLPEPSVRHATALLDRDPATVMVVGPADLIDEAGSVIWRDTPLSASPTRPIGRAAIDALRVFAGAHHATLGLFRRSVVTSAGLSLPHTAGESGLSVRAMVFALALRGRVRYEPQYVSQRCVHSRSYTARFWSRSVADEWRRSWSYWRVGTAAWRAAATSRTTRLCAPPILAAAVARLVTRRALQRFGTAARAARAEQRAAR